MLEGKTLKSVNPEAARFYEELGNTPVRGVLHDTIGDIYLRYLDIPEKVVSNADFARLERAYRNYEANNSVANAAAFLDEAAKVQRIAGGNGYSVVSPYAKSKRGGRGGDCR